MALEFKKAKRNQVRIKVGIGGPSGSGKTMSSLLLAFGLVSAEHPDWSADDCWDKICVIDTENGSGSLYTGTTVGDTTIGEYNVVDMAPPYTPSSFIDAIHMAENHQMMVIIIDSLTHAWAGEGGSLDKQGKIAARSGNSYTAWREVTPEHNRLVDAMLQSRCHVIADMRAKMDYEQVKGQNGKSQVKAVGMGVQMRDGVEYEFTTFFMLDYEHTANATKDRTGMFDGKYFTITPKTGRAFYRWLNSGAKPKEPDADGGIKTTDQHTEPAYDKPAPKEEAKDGYSADNRNDSVPDSVFPDGGSGDPHGDSHRGNGVPAAEGTDDDFPIPPDEDEEANVTIEELDKVIRAACKGLKAEDKKAIGEKIKQVAGTGNYMKITDQAIINRLYTMFSKKEN